MTTREIDCPRCHEQCGWCSDYRHMHGKQTLPGSRKRCTIVAMHPDPVCPMCGGTKRVIATTTYAAIATEAGTAETGTGSVHEGADPQGIAQPSSGDHP